MAFSSFLSLAIVATASHAYSSLSSCLTFLGLSCFPLKTELGFSLSAPAAVANAAASFVLNDVTGAAATRTQLDSSSLPLFHDNPTHVSSFFSRGWSHVAISNPNVPPFSSSKLLRCSSYFTPPSLGAAFTASSTTTASAPAYSRTVSLSSASTSWTAASHLALAATTSLCSTRFFSSPAGDLVRICRRLVCVQHSSRLLCRSGGTSGHNTGWWRHRYLESSNSSVFPVIPNRRWGCNLLDSRIRRTSSAVFRKKLDVCIPTKEKRSSNTVYVCPPVAITTYHIEASQRRAVKTLRQKYPQQHHAQLPVAPPRLLLLDAPAGCQSLRKNAVVPRRLLRLVVPTKQQTVSQRQVQHIVHQQQKGWEICRQVQMSVLKPFVSTALHNSRRCSGCCGISFPSFCCSQRGRCPADALVKYVGAVFRDYSTAAPLAAAFFPKENGYNPFHYIPVNNWASGTTCVPPQKLLCATTLRTGRRTASLPLLLSATRCCGRRFIGGTSVGAACRRQQQHWRSGRWLDTIRTRPRCYLGIHQPDAVNISRDFYGNHLSRHNCLYSAPCSRGSDKTVVSSGALLAVCATQRRSTYFEIPDSNETTCATATFASSGVVPSFSVAHFSSASLLAVQRTTLYSGLHRVAPLCPLLGHHCAPHGHGFYGTLLVRGLPASSARHGSWLDVNVLKKHAVVSRTFRHTQCAAVLLSDRGYAYSPAFRYLSSVATVLLCRFNRLYDIIENVASLSRVLLPARATGGATPACIPSTSSPAPADGILTSPTFSDSATPPKRDLPQFQGVHTADMFFPTKKEAAVSFSASIGHPPETGAHHSAFFSARNIAAVSRSQTTILPPESDAPSTAGRKGGLQQKKGRFPFQRKKSVARVHAAFKTLKRGPECSTKSALVTSERKDLRRRTGTGASAAKTAKRPATTICDGRLVNAAAAKAHFYKSHSSTGDGSSLWRDYTSKKGKMQQEHNREVVSPHSTRSTVLTAGGGDALAAGIRRSSSSPGGMSSCTVAETPRQTHATQQTTQPRHLQERQADENISQKPGDRQGQRRTSMQRAQSAVDAPRDEQQSCTSPARLWLNVNTRSESTGGAAGDRDVRTGGVMRDQARCQSEDGKDSGREWYLRLMSFNLLAESLTDYKYGALDQNIVRWTNREKAIRDEIMRHRPDIGCMQEVDRNYYWHRFRSFLQALGYESVYKQKTNGRQDGLSTFWLKSRFEVLERRELELGRFPDQRFGAKPQVALLLLLRERVSPVTYSCSGRRSSGGSRELSHGGVSVVCDRRKSDRTPGAISETTCSQLMQHSELTAAEETSTRPEERRKGEIRGGTALRCASSEAASTCHHSSNRFAIASSAKERILKQGIREGSGIGGKKAPTAVSCVAHPPGDRIFIVANTHLLFDSKRGDIKLAQLLQLLHGVQEMRSAAIYRLQQELRSVSEVNHGSTPATHCRRATCSSSGIHLAHDWEKGLADSRTPSKAAQAGEEGVAAAERLVDVLLCGDFNFTPHSPLYQLLLQGVFDFRGLDPRKLSGQFLMERRAYKVDAEGYHGRGSTIIRSAWLRKRGYPPCCPASGGAELPFCFSGCERFTLNTGDRKCRLLMCSSPAESQSLSAADFKKPCSTSSAAGNSLQHTWSTHVVAHVPQRAQRHASGSLQLQQHRGDTSHLSQQSGPLYSSTSSRVADVFCSPPQWPCDANQVVLDGAESPDGRAAVPCAHSLDASGYLSSATAAVTPGTGFSHITSTPLKHSTLASPWLIQLPFRFRSAYALPRKSQKDAARCGDQGDDSENVAMEEPAFTAYHGWQKGCIDYVFYSSRELKVGYVYQFPPLRNAIKYGCCPNKLWPCSDHYSLVVDLVRIK